MRSNANARNAIPSQSFSFQRRRLITGGKDTLWRLWEALRGSTSRLRALKRQSSRIMSNGRVCRMARKGSYGDLTTISPTIISEQPVTSFNTHLAGGLKLKSCFNIQTCLAALILLLLNAYIYVYIHVLYVCVLIYIYIYIYVCICVCVYIYIYIYTQTHI